MLDNVDSDFKAMSSFSEIEADFTASLVVKLQDQISKGKQAIKGEDTIEQIDEWCEKLTSLSITDGQIAAETAVQKPLDIKMIDEVEEPQLDVLGEVAKYAKMLGW